MYSLLLFLFCTLRTGIESVVPGRWAGPVVTKNLAKQANLLLKKPTNIEPWTSTLLPHVHNIQTNYKSIILWGKWFQQKQKAMGSIDTSTRAERGSDPIPTPNGLPAGEDPVQPTAVDSNGASADSESLRKRKGSGVLPLEVGTRVMCRWRDGKYHPVKVIERRKFPCGGVNDYEYYVHYTECEWFLSSWVFYCFTFVNLE